jgi:hypothetical protein
MRKSEKQFKDSLRQKKVIFEKKRKRQKNEMDADTLARCKYMQLGCIHTIRRNGKKSSRGRKI